MDLPKLPKRYQDALLLVKQVLASPRDSNNEFIAGGSLRDLILNKPPNDIDIFVFQSFDKIEMFRQINVFDLDLMENRLYIPMLTMFSSFMTVTVRRAQKLSKVTESSLQ